MRDSLQKELFSTKPFSLKFYPQKKIPQNFFSKFFFAKKICIKRLLFQNFAQNNLRKLIILVFKQQTDIKKTSNCTILFCNVFVRSVALSRSFISFCNRAVALMFIQNTVNVDVQNLFSTSARSAAVFHYFCTIFLPDYLIFILQNS